MSQPGLVGSNERALIPAIVLQSGEHRHTTENGSVWEYSCALDLRETGEPRRTCRLRASGVKLDGAGVGARVSTPWGLMERLPDDGRDRGWRLRAADQKAAALVVPEEALSRGGIWCSAMGSWRYRVYASRVGSDGEQRIGWLSHERTVLQGAAPGETIVTPWGLMVWTGPIAMGRSAAPEQGWLLSGVRDRPLSAGLPAPRAPETIPELRVESLYLAAAVSLSWDGPSGHGIALSVTGWLGAETARGRLTFDPNACALNDFGDREACTQIALRSYDVALTRLRSPDPACLDRRLYAVTGAGLPAGLLLIVYPHGDRVYLKHEATIIPLYIDDDVP